MSHPFVVEAAISRIVQGISQSMSNLTRHSPPTDHPVFHDIAEGVANELYDLYEEIARLSQEVEDLKNG